MSKSRPAGIGYRGKLQEVGVLENDRRRSSSVVSLLKMTDQATKGSGNGIG